MSEIIRYEHVDISYKGELAVHDGSAWKRWACNKRRYLVSGT